MADISIPQAFGVPAAAGGPRWWEPVDPATPVTALNQRIDDPRWNGAVTLGVPGPIGSSEKASFRALHEVSGGVTRLLLSWYVKADNDLTRGADKLFVGFQRTGGRAVVFSIEAFSLTGALPNSPPFAPPLGTITTLEQTTPGGAWSVRATPTWLHDTANPSASRTRVWATTAPRWAINLSLPLTAGADVDNAGMNLGGTFKLWFELQIVAPAAGVVYGRFPEGVGVAGGNPPDPASWGTAHVGGTGGIGVSLAPHQVGTRNPSSSEIRYRTASPFPANTLFAEPSNTGPALPANAIAARFRLANWGSQPDWNAAPNLWTDIPGGSAVPNTVKPDGLPQCQFNWTLDAADPLKPDFVSGSRRTHQCMLVELSGAGVQFLNAGCYRNMDVVPASTFEREAEISVKQLPPLSGPRRTVYLYVEALNLPEDVEVRDPPAPKPRDDVLARAHGEREPPPPTFEDRAESKPTYIVHAFHETGNRVTIGGRDLPVLEAQTSFGYFIEHAGALFGWDHALTGAGITRVGHNLYKVMVPNDGSVTVTTTITALERPRPWWTRLLRWLRRLLQRLIAWVRSRLGT